MESRHAKRILVVALLAGCVVASAVLAALISPGTASAQGATPTLIPGVPVITPPAPLPTLDPTQFPTDGTPEPPPGGSPTPLPGPNPIQQIIRYFFQIFFPANTFREAIEGAARAIFEGTIEELREPLTVVLDVAVFGNGAVFGNVALPGELSAVADIMTRAAVPLWALSLAMMALGVLTRQAVGMGYGSNEVAGEAARWFFVALASGNAFLLVQFVHAGFGLLAREIAGLNRVSAGAMVEALLQGAIETPILILIIMVFIAIITIFVVIVTYVARYAITLAVAALAPLAIACEGIPYLRFVCRDWLSMFLRMELLQIVNLCVLVLFGHMMLFGGADGLVGSILRMVAMVGLASALIGINTAVFKQVFGTAIEAAQQMRVAVEQLIGGIAAVAGVALTGSPVPMLGMARPSQADATSGRDPELLPSSSSDESSGTSRAAGGSASGQYGSGGNSSTSASSRADGSSATSSRRAAYRVGRAGVSSTTGQSAEASESTGATPSNPVANGFAGSEEVTSSEERRTGQGKVSDGTKNQATADEKQTVDSNHTNRPSPQTPSVTASTGVGATEPSYDSATSARSSQAAPANHTPANGSASSDAINASGAKQTREVAIPDAASAGGVGATQSTAADTDALGARDRESSATEAESYPAPSTPPAPGTEQGAGENDASPVADIDANLGVSASASASGAGASPTQQLKPTGQALSDRSDFRRIASQAGVMARAFSRATRMDGIAGAALRGFGEGAAAGDLIRRQAENGTDFSGEGGQKDDLLQARGERFARYTLGAVTPSDAQTIASQLIDPPNGIAISQMREAYEAIAPIARDMAREYGSPTRAAAQGGYESYGEMVTAMAEERLRAQGYGANESPATSVNGGAGPVERWTATPPGQASGLTPYDYGMGAMAAGNLGARSGATPEWARTMRSLRQAYGDHTVAGTPFSDFVYGISSGQFGNEREAMQWLEGQVQQHVPSAGQRVDLWWQGSRRDHAHQVSTPHYDASQSQPDRFARFTLGAQTPDDIHHIAAYLTGQQKSYAAEQMREGYEAIAPLARDMSRQFGSPMRAAAVGGYDSYGQLVTAMAEERLRMQGVMPLSALSEAPTASGPIESWTAAPPGQGTASQSMTHYDYGMGGFVAGQLGASAGAGPEWARTMFSLRQAYGDHAMGGSVFSDFVRRVGGREFPSEREARQWLEAQVEQRPPTSGRDVRLWWKASARAGEARAAPPSAPSAPETKATNTKPEGSA